MKNVAVLTEDWAFVPFFHPHPREFAIQGKKTANARGSGWGRGEWLGAAGIDWCITRLIFMVHSLCCMILLRTLPSSIFNKGTANGYSHPQTHPLTHPHILIAHWTNHSESVYALFFLLLKKISYLLKSFFPLGHNGTSEKFRNSTQI